MFEIWCTLCGTKKCSFICIVRRSLCHLLPASSPPYIYHSFPYIQPNLHTYISKNMRLTAQHSPPVCPKSLLIYLRMARQQEKVFFSTSPSVLAPTQHTCNCTKNVLPRSAYILPSSYLPFSIQKEKKKLAQARP